MVNIRKLLNTIYETMKSCSTNQILISIIFDDSVIMYTCVWEKLICLSIPEEKAGIHEGGCDVMNRLEGFL